MQYSKQGLALTESFEGCKLAAYQDQTGVWTIGYGHTKGVHKGMVCTQAQAEAWLQEDIAFAVKFVNSRMISTVTQGQFDALCDFTYNLGCGSLNKSTLLKMVENKEFAAAADQFPRWDTAGHQVVAGLLRRRIAEEEEFKGKTVTQ